MQWTLNIHSDATAAIGIARRRGMGRIRHLDVTDLRIQEHFNDKKAFLHEVLGAENPADLLTKYTDRNVLDMALKTAGLAFMDGRSAVAPAAMGTTQAQSGLPSKPVPPSSTPRVDPQQKTDESKEVSGE